MSTSREFSEMTDGELAHYIDTELNGVYAIPQESEEKREETRRIIKEMKEKDPNVPSYIDTSKLKADESKSSK
ncbi:hypothetical protein HUG15_13785 [Salicibibacter cibarius]|uniref:Uncharacterized protein n=2 Tax=Salicibibacter TaxID=2685905 RepID=A0A7T6Z3U9_9BACI|nr:MULTISPECIES: hypothetical protein [Salicibibacter]QQK76528.1 hypothetical protein HUG15_13785 [Salicibibacter cibarius]QQK80406.1 hypothetical protein HUG20_11220 [Salicibibacter cibi]